MSKQSLILTEVEYPKVLYLVIKEKVTFQHIYTSQFVVSGGAIWVFLLKSDKKRAVESKELLNWLKEGPWLMVWVPMGGGSTSRAQKAPPRALSKPQKNYFSDMRIFF